MAYVEENRVRSPLPRWFMASCLRGVPAFFAAIGMGLSAGASESPAEAFESEIGPVLKEFCYDCHGEGASRGNVVFDQFQTHDQRLAHTDLWLRVLKNLRAGLMPPEKKPRPSPEQLARIEDWIKGEVFRIDPAHPDPGRVTLRRLNRVEYRNTIRDLTGFDFKVEEELPPDDTGYGFDTVGDVLTMSPLLLEKYMQAAETITVAAVPRTPWVVAEKLIPGADFRASEGKARGDRLSFYDEALVTQTFTAPHSGDYRIHLELQVLGQFDFDPGRCNVVFSADHRELLERELGWQNGARFSFEFDQAWEAGEHALALALKPLTPASEKRNSLDLRIVSARIEGPLDRSHWVRPDGFELFFDRDPPAETEGRRAYAREVLERFATRAYRRPIDTATLDRLVALAEAVYSQPEKQFEDGIAQALVPVLASPRFLFRIEAALEPDTPREHPQIDEYALASRLSYFLWSTLPDEELFRMAARGELRKNLQAQVRRMLADRRSEAFVENFVGQWLQVRDLEGIDINARIVLARDSGEEKEIERRRTRIRELFAIPEDQRTPEQRAELRELFQRRRRNNGPEVELDRELRRSLREETERTFAYVLREDRTVVELIDSDYTYLNERLARHYGLTNLNIEGPDLRRVSLPEDSPRGGILTQGATLIVTSNPTRTSPVKRGLFVLDNILGMPPPPPPADIPPLEDAEKEFEDRQPTLRETLAVHRANPLCNSCHNRMDPLGLALENFNALGMWREQERNQAIEPSGKLITGEPFGDIRELKRILSTRHHLDFYRCLTEKLLIYALGRGLEYYDVHAVDQIVTRLEREDGRFSALLMGVIESAPFQRRRDPARSPDDPRMRTAGNQQPELIDTPEARGDSAADLKGHPDLIETALAVPHENDH
jgi:hypothetical protein